MITQPHVGKRENKMTILICPTCSVSLQAFDKHYACINGHSFDKAKQGYVNLLLSHQKRTALPGDGKEMVDSRKNFLDKGFYKPIAKAVNQQIKKSLSSTPSTDLTQIVDIGCGVGYYLSSLQESLSLNGQDYWGVDISKEAIKCASKHKRINWLVASSKHLPFASNSVDIVLSVFSPLYLEEINRILSSHGKVIMVTPANKHLIELRSILFDRVEEHGPDKTLEKYSAVFDLKEQTSLCTSFSLSSQEDIYNLLKMTPFYWKSSAQKKEDLRKIEKLLLSIDVILWNFSKKQ